MNCAGLGGRVAFFESDLASIETHEATVAAVVNELGGIDCLVNNAGMGSVERGDFLGLKPENFDTIIDVNLRGTVFFTQGGGEIHAGGDGCAFSAQYRDDQFGFVGNDFARKA